MSASIDIVLIDGGDNVPGTTSSSPEPAPFRTAGPAERSVSRDASDFASRGNGKTPRKDEPSAFEAGSTLASTISKALGGVALIDTADRLRQAFVDVQKAVTGFQSAMSREPGEPAAAPSSESTRVEPINTRTARPADDDFIEGEFTVSPSVTKPAGDSPAKEFATRALSIPSRLPALPEAAISRTVAPAAASAAVAGESSAAAGITAVATKLGPLGAAIGGVTVAVAAGALVLKKSFDAINNATQEAANYNANAAVAVSNTEVRRELAALQRAEKLGPELARFENMRSKLEDKGQDLMTEILAILLKLANAAEPIFDVVGNGIDVLTASAELTNAQLATVIDFFDGGDFDFRKHFDAIAAAQGKQTKAVQDLLLFQRDKAEEEQEDPYLRDFLAQFGPVGQQI